jgi:hypothetical protein
MESCAHNSPVSLSRFEELMQYNNNEDNDNNNNNNNNSDKSSSSSSSNNKIVKAFTIRQTRENFVKKVSPRPTYCVFCKNNGT